MSEDYVDLKTLPFSTKQKDEERQWSVDELLATCEHPSISSQAQNVIEKLGLQEFISPKVLLSAILFRWFHTEFTQNSALQALLPSIPPFLDRFGSYLDGTFSDIEQLCSTCLEFVKVFSVWKNEDSRLLCRELVAQYQEAHLAIVQFKAALAPDGEEPEALKTLAQVKKKIRSILGQVGYGEELRKCDQIDQISRLKFIDIEAILAQQAAALFWQEMEVELRQQPPKWDRTLGLLKELHSRFRRLLGRRADQERIDSYIDVPFIQQMMGYGVFGLEELGTLFSNICECFLMVQSKADDDDLLKWRDEQAQAMSSEDFDWAAHVPQLMNQTFVRLDRIEDQIRAFRAQIASRRPSGGPSGASPGSSSRPGSASPGKTL